MENYTIIEQLDALLEFIVTKKDNHKIKDFYGTNQSLMDELSRKLQTDGHIIIEVKNAEPRLIQVRNKATIDGRLFYNLGGYKQKVIDDAINSSLIAQNEKRIIRNEIWLLRGTWVASIVGFLLLVWQVFLFYYPNYQEYPFHWIWEKMP